MPWIVGGAALIGGVLANRSSAKQAQDARDEAGRYSGTAHQREASDLSAAGLNRILSGTGGAGASTPSGMMASQIDPVSSSVSAFMQKKRLNQELKNMKETRTTTEAQGWAAAATADAQTAMAHNQAMQADINEELHTQSIMDTAIKSKAQRGHMDAAKFWSSKPYTVKRRLDAAAESVRILIPLTTPGHSAYGNRKRRR